MEFDVFKYLAQCLSYITIVTVFNTYMCLVYTAYVIVALKWTWDVYVSVCSNFAAFLFQLRFGAMQPLSSAPYLGVHREDVLPPSEPLPGGHARLHRGWSA